MHHVAPYHIESRYGPAVASNQSVSAATTYFGIPAGQLSPAYKMTCSDSLPNDSNGTTASDFYLTSDGHMVMIWYDGAILLLKRQ